MTKKQNYTAPEAEIIVVQIDEGLCKMSPVATRAVIYSVETDYWGDL